MEAQVATPQQHTHNVNDCFSFQRRHPMSNNCDLDSVEISHAETRFHYIRRIIEKLNLTKFFLPEPNEEQLYQEALCHLVHVLLTKRSPVIHEGIKLTILNFIHDMILNQLDKIIIGYRHNCKNDWCTKLGLNNREEQMQEILNKLNYLERRRLYDPPSDNEIGYYHLIKKYIGSMGIFFTSQKGLAGRVNSRFDCVTSMVELHYLEELEEGSRHLEQFSAHLRDTNVINGCDVKHLLGISERRVPEVIICGSKERSNMFYHHKFRLALLDLSSSPYAFIHPYHQEKECYEQILNVPPPHHVIKEVSVYSDHLWYQFFIKLASNITNFEKHCAHVANDILAKLSIPGSWEKLASFCIDEDEDEGLMCFITESVEKCNLSSTQLEDYAEDVDRFIKIAHYIREFLRCLREVKIHVSPYVDSSHRPKMPSDPYAVNLDWQALHAFTLFKNGSSFPVDELGQKEMLPDGLVPCSKNKNQGALSGRKEEDENGNVAMLKAILDEIRMIGDWHLERGLQTSRVRAS